VNFSPTSVFSPGTQLYKYNLLNCIGQGSFGQVWHAVDSALNREYAIKILKPGLTIDQRLREGRIGHSLAHNNLVKIHQADIVQNQTEDLVILAMDYLPNGSAERLANPAGFLPLPDVLRIGRDILQGLDYLHANCFFHNDIKPGNILLGPNRQGILSDYGITAVSANGGPVVAPGAYLLHRAPEVIQNGNVAVSTDIFQVGMTLFRLLVGLSTLSAKRDAMGSTAYDTACLNGTLISKSDFPNHIPASVRRVILKATHPDPAKRFRSSLDMRRQLEGLNFRGFWSIDSIGQEYGQCNQYRYIYSVTHDQAGLNSVSCRRTNLKSGRSQRILQFCKTGLSDKQARQKISEFKVHVVEGK